MPHNITTEIIEQLRATMVAFENQLFMHRSRRLKLAFLTGPSASPINAWTSDLSIGAEA
jgi:hypothetical protein